MTRDEIKEIVKEAIQEELQGFYVERERHYQDHQFVGTLREKCHSISNIVVALIVTAIIGGFFTLIGWGVSFWKSK